MNRFDKRWLAWSLLTVIFLCWPGPAAALLGGQRCPPTAEDAQGPFYRPDAPVLNKFGEGYLLTGQVKSAADCRVIPGAQIEIWMTGPDGNYDDRWRATTFSGPDGHYRFESHFPGSYGSRPPHIHIIVNAAGFGELVTQHYPKKETSEATFDLVLVPVGK